MPSFLTIPGELIQKIIVHAIHPGASPAPNPPPNKSDWTESVFYLESTNPQVYSLHGLYIQNQKPLFALSLTCCALYAHTREVWRTYGAQAPCTLDVMVKGNGNCYATWAMVPQSILEKEEIGGWRVDNLDINIRLLHDNCCTRFEKIGYLLKKLILDTLHYGPRCSPLPMFPWPNKRGRFPNSVGTIRLNYTPCFTGPSMSSTQKTEVLRLLGRSVRTFFPMADMFASDHTYIDLGRLREVEYVKVQNYEVCLEEELQVSLKYRELDDSDPPAVIPPGGAAGLGAGVGLGTSVFGAGYTRGGLFGAREPEPPRLTLRAVVHNNAETLKAVTRV